MNGKFSKGQISFATEFFDVGRIAYLPTQFPFILCLYQNISIYSMNTYKAD